ncbi:hypothetical protein L3Q82_000813 [Scortum barcoo]|uniref:Uncharacterized protein n=1 Tax=Scortum barcoo TaxID=214431 RepID=A0ACB8WDB9_9TELE|nr:hypothetical protein L3Q82_000813 [Scortum barcoo]
MNQTASVSHQIDCQPAKDTKRSDIKFLSLKRSEGLWRPDVCRVFSFSQYADISECPNYRMSFLSYNFTKTNEFVDVSPPQRNWKGIAISLLVIVVVCSLITMSVVVLTPAEVPGSSRSRLTVADLYKPEFSIHDPEARWISGTGSRRQQSEQRCPDFPQPRHFLQLFKGDWGPRGVPSQPPERDIVPPSVSSLEVFPEAFLRWDSWNTSLGRRPRGHPKLTWVPEPPAMPVSLGSRASSSLTNSFSPL